MKKIVFFSVLLIIGLLISQLLVFLDPVVRKGLEFALKNITLVFLAFIMIHVGIEFSIDKSRLKSYGWDYFVAFTAASLPWAFCAVYFVYFFPHQEGISKFNIWMDALLLARFASPTSAGVLFSMMAAAGLENTWVFKKARILAIFDDLDTIILLIPIKMMIVGFKWESIALLLAIGGLIYFAWKKMHSIRWKIQWPWILTYGVIITVICEVIYFVTESIEDVSPVQMEILLPAFVLGCALAYPKKGTLHAFFEKASEKNVKNWISACFILLVGVSMPSIDIKASENLSISTVCTHILIITLISNLGKMFPLFCYKKEASLKERLALSLGMCPRGEVGAGVVVVALGLIVHIDQSLIIIAMLSLALNLILTGPIILVIKKLLSNEAPVAKRSI